MVSVARLLLSAILGLILAMIIDNYVFTTSTQMTTLTLVLVCIAFVYYVISTGFFRWRLPYR